MGNQRLQKAASKVIFTYSPHKGISVFITISDYNGLKLQFSLKLPGGLIITQISRLYSKASDSVGLGYGLRFCILNKFQGMLLCPKNPAAQREGGKH